MKAAAGGCLPVKNVRGHDSTRDGFAQDGMKRLTRRPFRSSLAMLFPIGGTMDTAGIDWGSTLIKAYWRKNDEDRYVTADRYATAGGIAYMAGLTHEMHEDGIRRVRLTGIGGGTFAGHLEEGFDVVRASAGAIDDEIQLQAAGTRLLMERRGWAPKKMLIASIGTGVSYTKVNGRKAKRSPLGSAHGGGTILGLGRLIGEDDFGELEDAASGGVPCDLLVKDRLPETAGTPLGELVIAHFCKDKPSFQDKCASIFSFAACSIVKDLSVLSAIPFSPKEIVVIGKVSASRTFRYYLERTVEQFKRAAHFLQKCRLHFPERGEYAAAVGAWADISK